MSMRIPAIPFDAVLIAATRFAAVRCAAIRCASLRHALILSTAVLSILASCPWAGLRAQEGQTPPWRDESLSPEARAAALLQELTLEERISLLQFHQPAIPRLGMHAYSWWSEALHGVARNGFATVFPQAIGMAATWNTDLIRRQGEAVAVEARIKYDRALRDSGFTKTYQGLTFWSPNINIVRDPRWGRGQETFGEDPFLTASIGEAYVRGMQGNDPVYLKVAATAKHFAVHSGPEPLRHRFDAVAPPRDFRETYLPAFEHLVKDVGVEGVMCAYNSIWKHPCCANDSLLTGILRNEWGFRGHVVSDCWAISDMINGHKTYPAEKEAAAASLRAGCNLSCGPEMEAITAALAEGLVTPADIDSAAFHLLLTRVRLGMFSDPSVRPWFRTDSSLLCSKEYDTLAGRIASESMVLLVNREHFLPLPVGLGRIGVAGVIAADTFTLLGNYKGKPVDPVTFLRGIREIVPSGTQVVYTAGYMPPWDTLWNADSSAALARRALSDLSGTDTVIVVAGITPHLEGEEIEGKFPVGGFEWGDRTTLDLPSDQKRLIRSLRDAGKKIVLVVTSGSAVSLADEEGLTDAIIQAWYPGQRSGTALASIIFGFTNPSGRLPVTVYRSTADLPGFENYSMDNRTYRYFRGKPLYEFGYGLSYTSFGYDGISLPENNIGAGDTLRLSVRVSNTGEVDGREVVQAYVGKPGDQRTIRSLCAFAKPFIPAGGSVDVPLTISPRELRAFEEASGSMLVRPGRYRLWIGSSSSDVRLETEFFVH